MGYARHDSLGGPFDRSRAAAAKSGIDNSPLIADCCLALPATLSIEFLPDRMVNDIVPDNRL